jgi:hypothetical protein
VPQSKRDPKARQRRQEEDDAFAFRAIADRGHHVHTHEIHGFEQASHLRRRHRVALGYVAREP